MIDILLDGSLQPTDFFEHPRTVANFFRIIKDATHVWKIHGSRHYSEELGLFEK